MGLLGPNGAGKTTTFNMVVGVIRPDGGAVKFKDRDVTRWPMHRRARLGMGYLTQEPSVFRKMTVQQNILAILETCRIGRQERKIRLKYLLEELDLTPVADSMAYTLSGGEKRRLEITRALVTNPRALVLDEPTTGLDVVARHKFMEQVRNIARDGTTLILITHHVEEIIPEIGRVILLKSGRIAGDGHKRDLLTEARLGETFGGPVRLEQSGGYYFAREAASPSGETPRRVE